MTSKDTPHSSRDVNLAPITEDEEHPIESTNPDDLLSAQQQDDEEVKHSFK